MKTLRIKVKPNARNNSIEDIGDGTWLAQVKAPPTDGKANEALIRLIADHFDAQKSKVSIKSGAGTRVKTILIKS